MLTWEDETHPNILFCSCCFTFSIRMVYTNNMYNYKTNVYDVLGCFK